MPAIQPARLKIEIIELLTYFDRPADFVRQLHVLFGFYADRTRRSGQSGTPKPLIKAYNVPRQVIRRIKSDIAFQVVSYPESALSLADQLWDDNWFECRLLAISILGMIPFESNSRVIGRMQMWGKKCQEDVLLDVLLEDGALQLRNENPNEFLLLVEDWLSETEISSRKVGLRAVPALVMNSGFENLPAIYRLLAPIIRESASALETDMLLAIRALGKRSPQETAYFLKQKLMAPHKSGLGVITRRSLDVFPPDLQDSLREILREQMQR